MVFILHRPQLQNPWEEHIPEVRIGYKHFREQPPLRGVRKTNKANITAERVVLRAGSRITANVHRLVERAFPLRADGHMTIIRQRTGANVKILQSVPKKAFIVTQYYTIFPLRSKFPNIFARDNSFYTCSPLVHLFPPLKSTHWGSIMLLTIFTSFIYTLLLTFPYDYTHCLVSIFYALVKTVGKLLAPKICKYLLEDSLFSSSIPTALQ